jgi:hypothetical protein
MKVMKSESDRFSLALVKGGRKAAEHLHGNEIDLLREMTNAFQIVYGGQYKSRHHTKLA